MRDAAIRIIREIGVDTGGSNIQFAVNPADGRMIVIEMNPRVSRSSALASKATGFPIAKIAAKLAVGLTLDEISNDITRETPACFEPTIDYVVVKIPRWAFEKFEGADTRLGTQMKSVGEAMSIGRTFKESMQKALRSARDRPLRFRHGRQHEARRYAEGPSGTPADDLIERALVTPREDRIFTCTRLWSSAEVERVQRLTESTPGSWNSSGDRSGRTGIRAVVRRRGL